jgi:hypothetical protein
MELFIDNVAVDTDTASEMALSLSVGVVTDPRHGRAGYTRSLRLPATPNNDAVFGHAAQIHSRDRFNASAHTGRVEHEGCVLIEGPLTLTRAEQRPEGGSYEVHIIGAAREWASHAAAHSLASLPMDWSRTLSASSIAESWTEEDSPVRFLPVARETLSGDYSSGSVVPAVEVLSSDDYHPFIHAATLLRAIFADAGYRLESEFVEGEIFSSLYMSGNYPTRDVSVAKANMDFLARRFAAGSAAANSQGRVYADPYRAAYTVGNIVDAAGGESQEDVFARGGCFQMDDDRVAFIPTAAVSVGFQFHLRYTTDYRVKDRASLAGFDTVYLGEQTARTFTLANPWPDRRASFRPARSYSLAVFEHAAGRQYQLRYTRQTASGGTVDESSATLDARVSSVEVGGVLPVSDPVLHYRDSPASTWQPYCGDWALYDGFVSETGRIDVELTVRTAPETVTPGAPKFFDDIYFGGADPGMTITVSEKTWLRPVFYAQPTEGTKVGWAEVCAHDISRMDFIRGVMQMFNLRFLTDNRRRVVRCEPADAFYSSSRVVDWTERMDISRPVAIEEPAGDLSREMVWRYRTGGDSAVARFNRVNGGELGRWSTAVESVAASNEASVWENPAFTPSLNTDGVRLLAPSARLVQAGDVSTETLDRTENLNFAPKIVRYEGMKQLPKGERWGWPQTGEFYPMLAFHAPESGYTLCFEDRDGCTGLHERWDRDVRLWNHSRRVVAWMTLDETDIESLSFSTGEGADFRTLYRLLLDGEECLCRLEEVCDYSPGATSTKCIFIKHIP